MRRVGFIGLGVMGRPMAEHLLAGGCQLFVYARRPADPIFAERNVVRCASPADVARQADVVITVLPDTPDVEEVLFGPDGVADGICDGRTVVDMSSISPLATKAFAARMAELDCDYLDAPVSGGEVGAKAGTLTIMVGGKPAVFEAVKPLFEMMGRNITLIGGHGDGQTAKVANQIIVALNIQAVGEALLFAAKAGADPARVRQALMGGFASSRVLEVHGERMLTRNFAPGFRIGLHQKDLALALDAARRMQISLPSTAMVQELFNACAANGGAAWDHSGLVRALERLANLQIAPDVAAN